MYGAGAGYFAATLKRSSIKLTEIHGERNPVFPGMQQPEPIARNLGELCTAVKKRGANVGLATDGDADRLGVVDEKGEFLTPLQVFALLTLYLLEVRKQRGAIIKTVPSSSMLYRLGEIFQVPVYETPVGFKYVAPKMLEEDAVIGGEESGGFGYRGHVPERDGILSGLYFLDLMVRTGKSPSELVAYLYSKVGPHYYERVDTEFPAEEREAVTGRLSNSRPSQLAGLIVEKLDTTDGFRFLLEHRYWLLVRFSGTEPIIRIYAEADSPERVEKLLAAARKMAGV
jgi:phosphomannomutase